MIDVTLNCWAQMGKPTKRSSILHHYLHCNYLSSSTYNMSDKLQPVTHCFALISTDVRWRTRASQMKSIRTSSIMLARHSTYTSCLTQYWSYWPYTLNVRMFSTAKRYYYGPMTATHFFPPRIINRWQNFAITVHNQLQRWSPIINKEMLCQTFL